MAFDCIVLSRDEFDKKYHEAFEEPEFSEDFTEEDLYAEFEAFGAALRKELCKNWIADSWEGDFELGDDYMGSFHNCGGIYSGRIFCKKYIDTVINVISTLPHASEWVFHNVVEPNDDAAEEIPYEEFFIKDGKVYAVEY